jgi:sarcosine oxidase
VPTHDIIVLGCGAMGAAATLECAKRNLRVLAVDRAGVPNTASSHHGVTRLFRMSTFEHPAYVPLLREARADWDRLSADAACDLFERTGMLLAGPPAAAAVNDSIKACIDNVIDHEILDATEIHRRFPIFDVPPDYRALWEPGAGCLACERAIETMAAGARARGATILEHTPVRSWSATNDAVTIRTDDADHHAAALIITAGPWMPDLLARDLAIELTVTRQVQFWLDPPPDRPATPPEHPTWAFDEPSGFTFAFPLVHADTGCKTCRHLEPAPTTPDSIDRTITDADLAPIRAFLQRNAPALDTPVQRSSVCMYTQSPDSVFIVDRHPTHPNVAFACAFTGHGFKFAPVVGRALADLAIDARSELPIQPFSCARFARAT